MMGARIFCFLFLFFNLTFVLAEDKNKDNFFLLEDSLISKEKNHSFLRNWVLGVHYGITQFRGDIRQYDHYPAYQKDIDFYELRTAFGVSLEKRINALYSFTGELESGRFAGLRRKPQYVGYTIYEPWPNTYEDNGDKFITSFKEANLLLNINFSNVMSYIYKTRKRKKLLFEMKLGLGYNIYNTLRTNLLSGNYIHDFGYEMNEGVILGEQKKSFFNQPSETVYIYGIRSKYRMNDKLNFVLDYTIRNGNTDKWDGAIMSTQYARDKVAFFSFGVLYNLGVHNYRNYWVSPIEELKQEMLDLSVKIKGNPYRITKESSAQKSLAKRSVKEEEVRNILKSEQYDSIREANIVVFLDSMSHDNQPDINIDDNDNLFLARLINYNDSIFIDDDNDGVPNPKDLESNTPHGLLVNEFGVSFIDYNVDMNVSEMIFLPSVYFDVGVIDISPLNNNSLLTIASLLKSNNNLKLRVTGYIDIIGDATFNKQLASQRVNNVINYFTTNFNIDLERFITLIKEEDLFLYSNMRINLDVDFETKYNAFLHLNRRIKFEIID